MWMVSLVWTIMILPLWDKPSYFFNLFEIAFCFQLALLLKSPFHLIFFN